MDRGVRYPAGRVDVAKGTREEKAIRQQGAAARHKTVTQPQVKRGAPTTPQSLKCFLKASGLQLSGFIIVHLDVDVTRNSFSSIGHDPVLRPLLTLQSSRVLLRSVNGFVQAIPDRSCKQRYCCPALQHNDQLEKLRLITPRSIKNVSTFLSSQNVKGSSSLLRVCSSPMVSNDDRK